MEASGFDGYITIGRVPAPGTDKTYPITFDADRFQAAVATDAVVDVHHGRARG